MKLKNLGQKLKKKAIYLLIVLFLVAAVFFCFNIFRDSPEEVSTIENEEIISLPEVEKKNGQLEELIYNRQSVRNYKNQDISFNSISKIIWSTIGITVDGVSGPTRAAPSAGATNPLEVFLSAHEIEGLEAGIYHYLPEKHHLVKKIEGDKSELLAKAALNQQAVSNAAAVIIIAADYTRTTDKYGDRGEKYVHIEAGHVSQNVNLMAEKLGLAAVPIGAFENREIISILGGVDYKPLLIIPVAVP